MCLLGVILYPRVHTKQQKYDILQLYFLAGDYLECLMKKELSGDIARGERIASLLLKKGKNMSWLAERLDVERSLVSRWVNKGVRPHPGNIHRIAEELGTTAEYILTGEKSSSDEEASKVCDKITQDTVKRLESIIQSIHASNSALVSSLQDRIKHLESELTRLTEQSHHQEDRHHVRKKNPKVSGE